MKVLANGANSLRGIQLAEFAVTVAVALISAVGLLRFVGYLR